MNQQQPNLVMEQNQQNGNGQQTIRTFSQEQLETTFQNYRTGIMELKAQKEALVSQREDLDKKIHDVDIQIARTEGAALGLQNILNPQQQQQPSQN